MNAPQYSQQHYLQLPRHGNNLCSKTDEWVKMWHIHTQNRILFNYKKGMKFFTICSNTDDSEISMVSEIS